MVGRHQKIIKYKQANRPDQKNLFTSHRSYSPKKFQEVVLKDSEKRRRLSVEIISGGPYSRSQLDDDGFGSLPHTPTEFTVSSPSEFTNILDKI